MGLTKSKRLESVRIIISEIIMVLAVVATVTVLAFVVSGYWLNSEFKVERQGMLQVSSTPTGAYVNIDGEEPSWLSVTNISKVLSSGEHTVELTKDGYDSWTKTVNISEGLLYRLHYPRLFLNKRVSEPVLSVGVASGATISPDRNRAVLINNTSEWVMLDLNSETPKQTRIDISGLFSGINMEEDAKIGLFTGEVVGMDWDSDSNHLLLKTRAADSIEWVILDVNNPERSINLTKEFGADFDTVKILDHSSNTLLAVRNHNLHRIDLASKSISSVIIENIIDFDHMNNEVVFSAQHEGSSTDKQYYIGTFRLGDHNIREIESLPNPVQVSISRFYDEKYITTLHDNNIVLYHDSRNTYEETLSQELSFSPDSISVGHHGEFISFSKGNTLATLDMESNTIREWSTDGASFGWLDNDMIYSVNDSKLVVYDYDGLNRRELSENVSSHFPVVITDDRWLYYFRDGDLVREWLVEH